MDKKPEKLVPEVRFKGFTDDWEQHKLENVFTKYQKRINPTQQNLELWSLTIDQGLVAKTKRYDRSFLVRKNDIFNLVPKGYFVYNPMNITLGTIDVNKYHSIAVSGYYIVLKSNDQFNVAFLASLLHTSSMINKYKRFSTGSLLEKQRLQFPNFAKVKIISPRLSEQTKIGLLMNQVNNLIDLQQRKLEQLKQLKKAMLQYLLTTEKKSAPLIRNKNYNNKWDTTTFSKLLNYERPENYIVTNTNYRKNGIPVLTANKSFILGYTNEPNVYNKGEAIIFDDFTLENKFVNFPFMIKSSAIKILTSKVNYSLYFIFQLLQHTKFIKEGHARHYISVVQKQIVRIPPSYEEQESISDTFSRIQSLIKLQQNKIDQYTTLKKYLLQKLFI